eukprot:scaffold8191_cov1575-Pinguiococcus_pyrenoidosus.AAC.1
MDGSPSSRGRDSRASSPLLEYNRGAGLLGWRRRKSGGTSCAEMFGVLPISLRSPPQTVQNPVEDLTADAG